MCEHNRHSTKQEYRVGNKVRQKSRQKIENWPSCQSLSLVFLLHQHRVDFDERRKWCKNKTKACASTADIAQSKSSTLGTNWAKNHVKILKTEFKNFIFHFSFRARRRPLPTYAKSFDAFPYKYVINVLDTHKIIQNRVFSCGCAAYPFRNG